MATYASVADLAAYTEGLALPIAEDPEFARLSRIIERAERQIDGLLMWRGLPDEINHRRVRVEELDGWDRESLRMATCAQAEYRLLMGEDFFKGGQYSRVVGPDFETQGVMPTIGPRVWEELESASYKLFHTGGIARHGDPLGMYDEAWLWEER